MTPNAQFMTEFDRSILSDRDDMAALDYVSGNIDGTQRHAVRRVMWISGNISARDALCGQRGTIRAVSLSETEPVDCTKCLRRAAR